MQKRKLKIALTLVLVLAVFWGLSSQAAAGWVDTNGKWQYYDKYGNMVTNEWAKDNSGLWYYLDRNGDILTETWVEGTYYVDGNGVMLTNQWKKLRPASGDSFDDYSQQYWYYFSPNGKRVENGWKSIGDKKYYFDSQGKMCSGWVDNQYYLGGPDDGAMKTGWIKALSPGDLEKGAVDSDENKNWYYLSKNGTVLVPDGASDSKAGTKKINGSTYAFDSEGRMLTGWVNLSGERESSNISDYKYFGTENDGVMKVGWQYLKAPKFVAEDSWDDGYNWFYLSTSGVPRKGGKNNKYEKSDMVTIDGKRYLFDEYGRTKSGLVWVSNELYYFGTKEQCIIQTGYFASLKEADGTLSTFFFTSGSTDHGKGLTGVNGNYLYYKGKLQVASSKEKYRVISMNVGGSNKNYVVNTAGLIQADVSVTDGYGVVYKTNSKGILTYIYKDAVKGSDVVGEEPNEPNVDY